MNHRLIVLNLLVKFNTISILMLCNDIGLISGFYIKTAKLIIAKLAILNT